MRCPHCNKILLDDWIKKAGATLLGQSGGVAKARSRENASKAAKTRWKAAKKKSL